MVKVVSVTGQGNPPPPDPDIEDCQCEGKMQNFNVVYQGVSGVTITGHKKKGDLFKTYTNVQNGDALVFEGFDSKGRLESKTFLKINGSSETEIHTSCSIQILGQTYGDFYVIGYTDGEGSSCNIGPCANDTRLLRQLLLKMLLYISTPMGMQAFLLLKLIMVRMMTVRLVSLLINSISPALTSEKIQ